MKFILAFTLLISLTLRGASQLSWKLVKNKNGIKVSVATVENSRFKSIRVQLVVDGTISKLFNILSNMNQAVEWVYRTKTSSVLKRLNPYEFFYYTETLMPWPVNNRDAIIHLTINPDTANHILIVNALSVPDYIEKKNGMVRIPYSKASWHVTEANHKLDIDYCFEVNPGGSLPAWLVNMMADKGPYESFSKLKIKLKEQ